MAVEVFHIGGLQFSTPFRSVVAPQFDLLTRIGLHEPVLLGEAIHAMDRNRAPDALHYVAHLPRTQVKAVFRKLEGALATPGAVQARPHTHGTQFDFTYGHRPVRVFGMYGAVPPAAELLDAAPKALSSALMTPQQQVMVSGDYLASRFAGKPGDFERPQAASHAHKWLYG